MLYRRRLKFYLLKILHLHGSPHKVALGFALGCVINFIPTFGFAIPLAAFFAGLFRLNIVAAIIGDIVLKPLFPLCLYLDYRIGHLLGVSFFLGMFFNIFLFAAILYLISFILLKYYRSPLLRKLRNSKMFN